MALYLPEQGVQEREGTVLLQADSTKDPISYVLQPGLNPVVVPCSAPSAQRVVVLSLSSASLVKPSNASDQRSLMAVLVDLECIHDTAYTVAVAGS